MFRGEPIALWTIIIGVFFYLLTQLFGLILSQIIVINISFPLQSHFFLAFFGWISFIILGAQLQFFRAITGLRKYEPELLRVLFLGSLIGGLLLLVLGTSLNTYFIVILGALIYFIGVIIHFYWLFKQSLSRLFKFPLEYFLTAQLFYISTFLLLLWQIHKSPTAEIGNNTDIIHLLGIGWISLTLQGALIRIFPMFMGKNIDRASRPYLPHHFKFSFSFSIIFLLGYFLKVHNNILLTIGGLGWIISWIWAFYILFQSIYRNKMKNQYKESFLFFLPGLFWLSIGALFGFIYEFYPEMITSIRPLHIHLTLLTGLSLIMLGAIHRIHAFQIYTLLYTGKRQSKESFKFNLAYFLKMKQIKYIAIGLNISSLLIIGGFYLNNYDIVGFAGVLNVILTILFIIVLSQNIHHYLINKGNAIPFWLKSQEYTNSG